MCVSLHFQKVAQLGHHRVSKAGLYTSVHLKRHCCAGKYPSEVFMFWYVLIIFINSVLIYAKTRIKHFLWRVNKYLLHN